MRRRRGHTVNKIFGTILVLVVGIISAVFGKEVVHWALTPSTTTVASQIEEGLKRAVTQIKTTVPKKIYDATTLTDAGSSGVVL
jgi:hypothetical protein